jgi:hypothetical protein
MTKLDRVFDAIAQERNYQDRKWGGSGHDEKHDSGAWISYMETYIEEARSLDTHGDLQGALRKVLKATALGVATMEYLGVPTNESKGPSKDS